jgi:tetratricopeptide (TPR) repeat protein
MIGNKLKLLGLILFSLNLITACNVNYCSEEEIKHKISSYKTSKLPIESLITIDSLINYCKYESGDLYVDKAFKHESLNEWNYAVESYNKSLGFGYNKSLVFFNRAICYAKMQEIESAWLDYYSYVNENKFDSLRHLLLRYAINKNLKNYQLALQKLDTLQFHYSKEGFFYVERINLHLAAQDTANMCIALKKALDVDAFVGGDTNSYRNELIGICNSFAHSDFSQGRQVQSE